MSEQAPVYEASFRKDGLFEISDPEEPDRWVATDTPLECRP